VEEKKPNLSFAKRRKWFFYRPHLSSWLPACQRSFSLQSFGLQSKRLH